MKGEIHGVTTLMKLMYSFPALLDSTFGILLILFLSLFQIEEDEKLKKRKERFGALTNAGSAGAAGAADVEVRFLSIPHIYVDNSQNVVSYT